MAARRRGRVEPKKIAWELRLLRWLLLTTLWRLPRLLLRLTWSVTAWLLGLLTLPFRRRTEEVETADSFYRSHKWRRLRVDALEANRQRYGFLACECCGMVDTESFHVDHIYPRSTHPDLALEPDNLQVLCADCNIGKGTAYRTNWRGGSDPEPARPTGWQRLLGRRAG